MAAAADLLKAVPADSTFRGVAALQLVGINKWHGVDRSDTALTFRLVSESVECAPELVSNHAWLGRLLAAEGRTEEARRHLERARDAQAVVSLAADVPRRRPARPRRGDLLAIAAKPDVWYLALVLERNRIGTALGLLRGLLPVPRTGVGTTSGCSGCFPANRRSTTGRSSTSPASTSASSARWRRWRRADSGSSGSRRRRRWACWTARTGRPG
ncbi:hypothetical protein [Streptomyces sp. NPDC005407]|uniref:hypothetical protein n=1 Tax=Streptomyces sp. NPDC005407 TaxID=3155340 RepID=UPI0033A87DA5